jgi:hypothetical protein
MTFALNTGNNKVDVQLDFFKSANRLQIADGIYDVDVETGAITFVRFAENFMGGISLFNGAFNETTHANEFHFQVSCKDLSKVTLKGYLVQVQKDEATGKSFVNFPRYVRYKK